ncbi:hypothetical protein Tco_1137800 [Tanacetum coccineum]
MLRATFPWLLLLHCRKYDVPENKLLLETPIGVNLLIAVTTYELRFHIMIWSKFSGQAGSDEGSNQANSDNIQATIALLTLSHFYYQVPYPKRNVLMNGLKTSGT